MAATDWRRRAIVIARAPALAFFGYFLLIFFAQRFLAFPGQFRDIERAVATAPDGVVQVWLETSFGDVEAWFFPAVEPAAAPSIVFAHGNGELIDDWGPELRLLAENGVNALAVEFPGYGHSAGKPTRETLGEAYMAAFDWLADGGTVDPDRIIAYGRSMGGGAAGDLALARPVAALVLQSTFTSTMAMARSSLAPGFLVRDRFDNERAVRDFDGPALLMHGPEDDVIPYAHGQALAAARSGLELIDIDCRHNDCARVWPAVVETFLEFLIEEGLLEPPTP